LGWGNGGKPARFVVPVDGEFMTHLGKKKKSGTYRSMDDRGGVPRGWSRAPEPMRRSSRAGSARVPRRDATPIEGRLRRRVAEAEQIILDALGHSKRGTVIAGRPGRPGGRAAGRHDGTWPRIRRLTDRRRKNRWLNASVTLPNHGGGSPLPDD